MWIESCPGTGTLLVCRLSLPLRECGLKVQHRAYIVIEILVTPLAGVWIERADNVLQYVLIHVTPLAGVWIESS